MKMMKISKLRKLMNNLVKGVMKRRRKINSKNKIKNKKQNEILVIL